MKVVIGLGNPGKKYEKTRHNIGFIAVDSLRKKFNISDEREKFQALVSEKNIDGEKVIFFKPQTFMNLSGNSVIEIINFYKLDPKKDIIVFMMIWIYLLEILELEKREALVDIME